MKKKAYITKEQLESSLKNRVTPFQLNKVLSAYEMAENAHQTHLLKDGTPYFNHISRVCHIIINELNIFDSDLIAASLLHAIHKTDEKISQETIEFNFGPYVAFLIENLNSDNIFFETEPTKLHFDFQDKIRVPGDDFLIIRLSETLAYFRSLEFNPVYNPINYILETSKKYFGIVENCANHYLDYLVKEIKKERNKIFG